MRYRAIVGTTYGLTGLEADDAISLAEGCQVISYWLESQTGKIEYSHSEIARSKAAALG